MRGIGGRGHDQLVRHAPGAGPSRCSCRRCCTPKRCCSSTMTSARFANCDALLEQRVRADHDAHRAGRRSPRARCAARARLRSRYSSATGLVQRLEPVAQVAPVLLGEQLGGRHQRRLQTAARRRAPPPRRRHHGLAAADIALHQARHGRVRREVGVGIASARAPARAVSGTAARPGSAARDWPHRLTADAGSALSVRWRSFRAGWCASSSSRAKPLLRGWRRRRVRRAAPRAAGGASVLSAASSERQARAGSERRRLGDRSRARARSSSRSARPPARAAGLRHAFGQRVDRRERVSSQRRGLLREARDTPGARSPAPAGRGAHLAEAAQARAARQVCCCWLEEK